MQSAACVHFTDLHPHPRSFREDALAGLRASPKRISPKYFYDRRGSRLFERITELEEYYPSRTETGILSRAATEIGQLSGEDCLLIEYGSGGSTKTPIVLDALPGRPAYLAIDISRDHLLAACEAISNRYPDIDVYAVCADYTHPIPLPAGTGSNRRRLAFFPGSTIGNFTPGAAEDFLRAAAATVGPDGAMLIGVDLKKDPAVLDRAYNDDERVTAAFNLNVLRRMNRDLETDFDLTAFGHKAFYNEQAGRIEMHLESLKAQTVRLGEVEIQFDRAETIHTENSYKYSLEEFRALARRAGFRGTQVWTDDRNWFSVHWLETA